MHAQTHGTGGLSVRILCNLCALVIVDQMNNNLEVGMDGLGAFSRMDFQ
jgi:hypothetical protein